MNGFALLALAAGMMMANTALAGDAPFCESMCESQQRECRGSVQAAPLAPGLTASGGDQRNPLARTAQGAVPGQGTRALDAAGDTGRRMTRLGACETGFQRCTRSCAVSPAARGANDARTLPGATAAPR